MIHIIKYVIKQTPLYHPLRNWLVKREHSKQFQTWENAGRPAPPPHIVKQRTLQAYAIKYGLRVLVETGTYYGDMVEEMKAFFDRIYSIELSRDLHHKAKKRFRGVKHINLIHWDSANVLKKIMNDIDQSALFWLDAHYSAGDTAKGEKDTPVYEELQYILSAKDMGHVIVIDDARCFWKDPAYPTIKELKEFILAKRGNVEILIKDDSIRIIPKLEPSNCKERVMS